MQIEKERKESEKIKQERFERESIQAKKAEELR